MSETVILFIIGQTVAILGVVLTAYMKIITRQRELEIRVKHIERQDENVLNKLDANYKEILSIKDMLSNEIHEIKVKLATLPCDEHSMEKLLTKIKNKEL